MEYPIQKVIEADYKERKPFRLDWRDVVLGFELAIIVPMFALIILDGIFPGLL